MGSNSILSALFFSNLLKVLFHVDRTSCRAVCKSNVLTSGLLLTTNAVIMPSVGSVGSLILLPLIVGFQNCLDVAKPHETGTDTSSCNLDSNDAPHAFQQRSHLLVQQAVPCYVKTHNQNYRSNSTGNYENQMLRERNNDMEPTNYANHQVTPKLPLTPP